MAKQLMESEVTVRYKDVMLRMLSLAFPHLKKYDIERAVDFSIQKRYKDEPASIYNNYTEKTANLTLRDITDYIYDREPIVTMSGVLFKRHGQVKNPLLKLMQRFLDKRDIDKSKMFEFPKGSDEFEFWNLMQLLDKIDANGLNISPTMQ